MAQYMLSVWHDTEYEIDFSSDDAQRLMAQVGAFNDELTAADYEIICGVLLNG